MLEIINQILETVCYLFVLYMVFKVLRNLKIFNDFVLDIEKREQEDQEQELEKSSRFSNQPPPELTNLLHSIFGEENVEIKSFSVRKKEDAKTPLQILEIQLQDQLEMENYEAAGIISKKIKKLKQQIINNKST